MTEIEKAVQPFVLHSPEMLMGIKRYLRNTKRYYFLLKK